MGLSESPPTGLLGGDDHGEPGANESGTTGSMNWSLCSPSARQVSFRLDGHHMQFNVVTADLLREAKADPASHRDS